MSVISSQVTIVARVDATTTNEYLEAIPIFHFMTEKPIKTVTGMWRM
jgi:hypothetical protein